MLSRIVNKDSLNLNKNDRPGLLLSQIVIDFQKHPLALHERKRERLFTCDTYEIVLMHWGPGSSTVLHGHGGSDCFMKILSGSLIEKRFRPFSNTLQEENFLAAGMDTYICDEESFHTLHSEQEAVSLHIYSKPLAFLQVLDHASNSWENREPQIF
ncbi:MAG: cysteine dioxygenase family protein [Bacteriovoracaceae bacterium]|nr:cysteine dioxygenase family protein [Bacteriovoracaceae bacterium]